MVGFTGDCHDNALAEASTLLFTAVLIGDKVPRPSVDSLEIAATEHIDWLNHPRLHGQSGLLPPVEHPTPAPADAALPGLQSTRGETPGSVPGTRRC